LLGPQAESAGLVQLCDLVEHWYKIRSRRIGGRHQLSRLRKKVFHVNAPSLTLGLEHPLDDRG
jgi:hypothetical protein